MKFLKASKFILLLVIFFMPFSLPQSITLGTEMGGGFISSNSPAVGSFSSLIYIEAGLTEENYTGYRLSVFYTGDFSSLLPADRSVYYPFIKGASLKFIHSAFIESNFFFEQGIGLLLLNDRVFSDRNRWGYGFSVSLVLGKDFRSQDYAGLKAGIGTEYGLTFIDFSANYFTIFLQLSYTF